MAREFAFESVAAAMEANRIKRAQALAAVNVLDGRLNLLREFISSALEALPPEDREEFASRLRVSVRVHEAGSGEPARMEFSLTVTNE